MLCQSSVTRYTKQTPGNNARYLPLTKRAIQKTQLDREGIRQIRLRFVLPSLCVFNDVDEKCLHPIHSIGCYSYPCLP